MFLAGNVLTAVATILDYVLWLWELRGEIRLALAQLAAATNLAAEIESGI